MFIERGTREDRHRRLRGLKRDQNWLEAAPPTPKRCHVSTLEREVRLDTPTVINDHSAAIFFK